MDQCFLRFVIYLNCEHMVIIYWTMSLDCNYDPPKNVSVFAVFLYRAIIITRQGWPDCNLFTKPNKVAYHRNQTVMVA